MKRKTVQHYSGMGYAILFCFLIKEVVSIKAPSFTSGWIRMASDGTSTTIASFTHGLGVWPAKAEVQVRSLDDPNKGFIFPGVKSAHGDNDNNAYRGGVICIYNKVFAKLIVADNYGSANGGLIYTGLRANQTAHWGPNNLQFSTSAEVRVRVWTENDLGVPDYTSAWLELTSESTSISGTPFREFFHFLGEEPMLVVVQLYMTQSGGGWLNEGQGSSMFESRLPTDPVYRIQNSGGVMFAYNSSSIRVWAPTFTPRIYDPLIPSYYGTFGGLYSSCDGWGEFNLIAQEGQIRVMAWRSGDAPITSTIPSLYDVNDVTISPFEHHLDLNTIDIDTDLVVAKARAVNGLNTGYNFYGFGSAMADVDLLGFGGFLYAYSETEVRLWHPIVTGTYIIHIPIDFGRGTLSQYSTLAVIEISVIHAYECAPLPTVADTNVNTTLKTNTYECAPGYQLDSGDLVRYCMPDGAWNGTAPLCKPIPSSTTTSTTTSTTSSTTTTTTTTTSTTTTTPTTTTTALTTTSTTSVPSTTTPTTTSVTTPTTSALNLTVLCALIQQQFSNVTSNSNVSLHESLAWILQNLLIGRKNTSKYHRSLVSIDDNRPIAVGLGWTGALLMVILFGCVVVLDVLKFFGPQTANTGPSKRSSQRKSRDVSTDKEVGEVTTEGEVSDTDITLPDADESLNSSEVNTDIKTSEEVNDINVPENDTRDNPSPRLSPHLL